jgi:hypothetical protein
MTAANVFRTGSSISTMCFKVGGNRVEFVLTACHHSSDTVRSQWRQLASKRRSRKATLLHIVHSSLKFSLLS